jgi:hypothetical protein
LLTPNDPIPQGQHTLAHAWRDPAGNTSASSPSTAVTIDTQAPATTAVIGAANDDVGIVTGAVNSGGVTDDTRPALSGTLSEALAAGETLRVYDGATYLGNATVVGTDWTFEVSQALSHGDAPSYSVRVTDAAGNRGTASNSYSLNIDTQAPATPTFAINDDVGMYMGPLTSGAFTDDTRPALSGNNAEPGAVVRVFDGATVVGSALVDANGSWSVTTDPLREGLHALTLTQTDPAGNVSPATTAVNITVDTTAPGVPLNVVLTDNMGVDVGEVLNGDTTDDATPTLSGQAAQGAVRVHAGIDEVGG